MNDDAFVQARQDARDTYEAERRLGQTHAAASETASRQFRERIDAAGATGKRREDLLMAFSNDIVQLGDAWAPQH